MINKKQKKKKPKNVHATNQTPDFKNENNKRKNFVCDFSVVLGLDNMVAIATLLITDKISLANFPGEILEKL